MTVEIATVLYKNVEFVNNEHKRVYYTTFDYQQLFMKSP
jgi:hypothetical protein